MCLFIQCFFMFTATCKKRCFQTNQEEPFQCNLETSQANQEKLFKHLNYIFILQKFPYFTFAKEFQNVQDKVVATFCDLI